MKILGIVLGVLIALALAGNVIANSDGEDKATAGGPPVETTTTETAEPVDDHAADDELVAYVLRHGAEPVSKICQTMPILGRERTEQMGKKILGPTIIKSGGDVTYVIDELLDAC